MELKGTKYLTRENTYDSKKNICKLWDWNRNAWNILEMILYCLFLCSCLWGPHAQLSQRWTWTLLWPKHGRATQKARMLQLLGLQYKSHRIRCMQLWLCMFFFILPRISEKILHACILQWSAGVSWNNYLKTRYHVTIVLGNEELFGVSFLLASQSEVQQGHLVSLPLLLFYYPSLRGNLCSKYTLSYIQYRHLLYPTRACSISSCCVSCHIIWGWILKFGPPPRQSVLSSSACLWYFGPSTMVSTLSCKRCANTLNWTWKNWIEKPYIYIRGSFHLTFLSVNYK